MLKKGSRSFAKCLDSFVLLIFLGSNMFKYRWIIDFFSLYFRAWRPEAVGSKLLRNLLRAREGERSRGEPIMDTIPVHLCIQFFLDMHYIEASNCYQSSKWERERGRWGIMTNHGYSTCLLLYQVFFLLTILLATITIAVFHKWNIKLLKHYLPGRY